MSHRFVPPKKFHQPFHKQQNHRPQTDAEILEQSIRMSVEAMERDADYAKLAQAKKDRNTTEMARLMPICQRRYGKDFVKMFRML